MIPLQVMSIGISFLVIGSADGSQWIIGLIVVNLFAIAKQLIDKRAETNRLTIEHNFRVADAEKTAAVRASINANIEANRAALDVVAQKAEEAIATANHTNEKIASGIQSSLGHLDSVRNDFAKAQDRIMVAALSADAKTQIRSAVRHELANFLQSVVMEQESCVSFGRKPPAIHPPVILVQD